MKQIRRHLTYANVMSSFAVFLILGGATAIAASSKIGATQLKANSVKTGKIVKEAVTTGKIKNSAVNSFKLADGSVISVKLADGSVLTAKIANGAVTTEKLADKAVTAAKLGENAVTTGKIQNSAVNTEKLANEAVTLAKLGNGSVHAAKLGPANFTLGNSVSVPAGETSVSTLECPGGTRMLSGGPLNSGTSKELVVLGSHPNTPSQWRVQLYNSDVVAHSYSIVVHCLQP